MLLDLEGILPNPAKIKVDGSGVVWALD